MCISMGFEVGWPGCMNDAGVWNSSSLKKWVEAKWPTWEAAPIHVPGIGTMNIRPVILGDAIYPCA